MKVETKLISPDYASILLGKNDSNRSLSKNIVNKYAEEMKLGNWQLNGDAIRIDVDGNLLDGQHRLKACIISRVPLETVVISGLPHSTFKTMDAGRVRTAADTFKVEGYSYTGALSASARFVKQWLLGERKVSSYNGGAYKFSNTVMLDFVRAHPNLETCCQICSTDYSRVSKFVGIGLAAGCFYLFDRKDPKLAEEFYTKLNSGVNLEAGDIILSLRDKLAELQAGKLRVMAGTRALLLIQTWNKLRKGKTQGKVILSNVDDLPEIN